MKEFEKDPRIIQTSQSRIVNVLFLEAAMKTTEDQPKSFEASLEALEEIVHQLEGGDLPLEKSLELFEDGIRLSRQCQERLSQAERRIELLLRDNQGRPVVSPFEKVISEENSAD
jgi:exodeoxyribonuclease VII small subunit